MRNAVIGVADGSFLTSWRFHQTTNNHGEYLGPIGNEQCDGITKLKKGSDVTFTSWIRRKQMAESVADSSSHRRQERDISYTLARAD